ncbi:MAG: two-component sensor histidine kinase [Chitinophagaceae bacterium]|nr:two-component sensor histidine kinase [Chitinophagaceae bacterium]
MVLSALTERLVNFGVYPGLDFEERKKTRLLNICFLITMPIILFLAVLNFFTGHEEVVVFNLLVLTCQLLFFYINYKHKFLAGRIFISITCSILFSYSALKFQNGTIDYLLVNIIAITLLLNKRRLVLLITSFTAVLYITVRIILIYSPRTGDLPLWRQVTHPIVSTLLIILIMQRFKKEHFTYLEEADQKTVELEDKQARMTEQQTELEEKNKQLEILNQTKEKLFSIVAHDIRSPIAALRSSLDLFNKDMISKEEFQALSGELTIQVDQLQDNLDNLLHWSHSQLQGIEVNPRKIFISTLIKKTVELMKVNISNKKITIDVRCPEFVAAYADEEHVKLILRNLLSNAIKFSFFGSHINIHCEASSHFISISIEDFGKGIEEKRIHSLFIYSGTSSTRGTLNEKGTGLGLLLTKEFIEKNGGSLIVKSAEGKGSTFCFTLPATS